MHTRLETLPDKTAFIIADLPETYHRLVQKWDYAPVDHGFAKAFPSDTPGLEQIYRRFSTCIEEVIGQAAGERPVPWQDTLLQLLARLEGQDVDWFLGGSAALAVQGVKVQPHDVDLVSSNAGALRIGEILADWLYEPMTPYTGWICDWGGHAFQGARVEWVGGVHADIDKDAVSDFGPAAAARLETVTWRGYRLRVAPLEMQMEVSRQRGLAERAAAIQQVIGGKE